jgi:flap endonuclease-1
VLEKLDSKKYPVPEDWPYKEARKLFLNPEITDPKDIDLKWTQADEEGVVDYLVKQKGFRLLLILTL